MPRFALKCENCEAKKGASSQKYKIIHKSKMATGR
jgi:hypothetical protein